MKRKLYLDIDIYKRNTISETLKQLDTTELIVSLYANSEKLNIKELIPQANFQLNFLKADKTLCIMKNQSKFSLVDNVLTVVLDKDCLRTAGRGFFEIFIYKDGTYNELLSTFLIPITIESSVSDKTPSKNKIDILEQINVAISEELNEALKTLNEKISEADNTLNNLNQAIEDSKTAIDHATVITRDELIAEVQKQLEGIQVGGISEQAVVEKIKELALQKANNTANKMFKTDDYGNIVETSFNADILDNLKSNIQAQIDNIVNSLDNITFESVYATAKISEDINNNSELKVVLNSSNIKLNNNCFDTSTYTIKKTADYEVNVIINAKANGFNGDISEINVDLQSEKDSTVSHLASCKYYINNTSAIIKEIPINLRYFDTIAANSKLKLKVTVKNSNNTNSVWIRALISIKKL